MPNELMKTLAKDGGYCCIFSFFRVYGLTGQNNLVGEEARKIAEKIGVVPRTIYNWNRRIRDQKCCCEGRPFCTNLSSFHPKE